MLNWHTSDHHITSQTACLSVAEQVQALGLESFLSPHALRHFFLDDLANKGVDLRILSDLAGHADVRLTDRTYLGPVRTQELVKAVRKAKGE